MLGREFATPNSNLLSERSVSTLHPARSADGPSDDGSSHPPRYHLTGSVALTTRPQCDEITSHRSLSPLILVNKCVMPAILDANTPPDLTHEAFQLYLKLRHHIVTTPFAGELGTFHDNGDGSNRVTEEHVRAAVLRDVYGGKENKFNADITRMRDYQDFGGFVDRLKKAECYRVLEDGLPGSDVVIPVVLFHNLHIQMSLYRLILHIIAPGMCEHLVLPDGNTVTTTLVPGLFRVEGAIHLYWTEPGPAGPLVDMETFVQPSSSNDSPFTHRHLLVLTNGLCYKASCGRPLQILDAGVHIALYPDGRGGSMNKILRAAYPVLACMTRLAPLVLRKLKDDWKLTVDHVAVNHHHHPPDLLRLATRSEQALNVIRGRDNGDATSGMTWMTLKEFAAYLFSLRSSAGKGTAAAVDYIDDIDTIDGIVRLLLDEERWVVAGAAAWGWSGKDLQKLVTAGTRQEDIKAPILPATNLEIHVNLACARRSEGGLHKYAMSEHGSWEDRNRYPRITATLDGPDGTSRCVRFHILLMTTAAMNLDAFKGLGAAHGMLLGSAWDPTAPRVVPFELAFSRDADGKLYQQAFVMTPQNVWQTVDFDHVHREVRYARYNSIAMVTHAENVRRGSGYSIGAVMSFHAAPNEVKKTVKLPSATLNDFCKWTADNLGISLHQVTGWWKRRLSKDNHLPGRHVLDAEKKGFETVMVKKKVGLFLSVDGAEMRVAPGENGDTGKIVFSGDLTSVLKSHQLGAYLWMLVRFCETNPVATILYGEQGCLDFVCDQLMDARLRLDPVRTTDMLVTEMRGMRDTTTWPVSHHMCQYERYVFRPLCHAPDRDFNGHVPSALLRAAVMAVDEDAQAAAIAEIIRHYCFY